MGKSCAWHALASSACVNIENACANTRDLSAILKKSSIALAHIVIFVLLFAFALGMNTAGVCAYICVSSDSNRLAFPHSNEQWCSVEVRMDTNTRNAWKCPPQLLSRSGSIVCTHRIDQFRYIKILTWFRGLGKQNKRNKIFIRKSQCDFFCFIPLSFGAKYKFYNCVQWYMHSD